MSIDLTALPIRAATPMPQRAGGMQASALGGAILQVDRMGDRWSFQFETPQMKLEPDGRLWQALFDQAEGAGAIVRVKQPGFVVGTPGTPVVASNTAAGRSVPLSGLTAGYPVKAGQWLSIIHAGRSYLDKVVADVTASGGGTATVTLKNLIRTPLSAGDVVALAAPVIEGVISGDYNAPWPSNRLAAFSFTVTEVR
jgi:hypothetical protein